MRPAALFTRLGAAMLVAAGAAAGVGCGGNAGLGDACGDNGDCQSLLQCQQSVCVPRCLRAPECGDGFQCTSDGICVAATGQSGDACTSETDCAAGLACQLDGSAVGSDGRLLATCGAATGERPAEAACAADADCRNGTCALGRCVDLCAPDLATYSDGSLACVDGDTCVVVPRVGDARGAPFGGCLPDHATITWTIPTAGPESTIEVPVPSNAASIELSMQVDDVNQEVGALSVRDPNGAELFDISLNPFTTPVRHAPALAQSVLAMPSSPSTPLVTGAYEITVASLRPPFGPQPVIGAATPHVTAVAKLGIGISLDLHFYFLDFTDHPCAANLGPDTLDAAAAATTGSLFQSEYLGELHRVFALGGIALEQLTYEDLTGHPDLDGLDVADAGELLALGAHTGGINVFFVRSLSPVGLQTFGPNPGPAGIAGTAESGVVIGLDTMCYRSWQDLARLTAHELCHYMGLYDNVTLEHPDETDPIMDTGSDSSNLMFYSELGGTDLAAGHGIVLTPQQQAILQASGVLR